MQSEGTSLKKMFPFLWIDVAALKLFTRVMGTLLNRKELFKELLALKTVWIEHVSIPFSTHLPVFAGTRFLKGSEERHKKFMDGGGGVRRSLLLLFF